MTLQAVWQFALDHEAVICLLGLAYAVTMPDELPPPFNRSPVLNWLWAWFHSGLKAFVSFRSPVSVQRSTFTQETAGASTTQISESKTDAVSPGKGAS
jgi:hypothetical protein